MNTSWLSKIGSVFSATAKVAQAVQPLVPLVAGVLPAGPGGQIMDVFNGTTAVIGNVQAMFNAAYGDGQQLDQRMTAVKPFVVGLITSSAWMLDKQIIDQKRFDDGVEQLVEGVLDICKSVEQLPASAVNDRIQAARVVQAQNSGNHTPGTGLQGLR